MNNYFVPDSIIDRMAIEETARKNGTLVIPSYIDRDYILDEAKEYGLEDRIEVKYWHETIKENTPCIFLFGNDILSDIFKTDYDKSSVFMED